MGSKLIKIEKTEKVIFVGDTHGDLEASQKVLRDYLRPGNNIVFLGDYVDRGAFSKENLDFLLGNKEKYPNQIRLLQGNHEGHHLLKFSPSEFWENLDKKTYTRFSRMVEKMGLVAVTKDIIALHGALPDVQKLEDVNKVKSGDKNWFQICWGDFSEEEGEYLGINPLTGRPQFGKDYFSKLMARFGKKVLIRSHQSDAPSFMFGNRCVTLFTCFAYTSERTIAITDPRKKIKTAKDLEIVKI